MKYSNEQLPKDVPVLMGIINTTPDSFSDGGQFISPDDAIETALDMVEYGATIVDIGGESSRPGAAPVALEAELRRVLPVVTGVSRGLLGKRFVSIDTTKADVAAACVSAGADIVNDISGGCVDPAMFDLIAESGAGLVIMHKKGEPANMQDDPYYEDVVAEVGGFFESRLAAASRAGIARNKIMLDPGIGFGKRLEDNLELLTSLSRYRFFGLPLVIGVSRKSLIGDMLGGAGVGERLEGGFALMAHAWDNGARIFRVHDIPQTRRFLLVWSQLTKPSAR